MFTIKNLISYLQPVRKHTYLSYWNKINWKETNDLHKLIEKYEDKILYSGYVESKRLKLGYKQNMAVISKQIRKEQDRIVKLQSIEPIPVTLKYYSECFKEEAHTNTKDETEDETGKDKLTQFPFQKSDDVVAFDTDCLIQNECEDVASLADVEIKTRLKLLKEDPNNWMTDYENYDDCVLENNIQSRINYGTPDPLSEVSNVPCGGCGALLHCKDTSIPGYIPSEIFKAHSMKGAVDLKGLTCQRCYFLKNYDLALQVRVSSSDYPEILKVIRDRQNSLVILMVDLLDFPCSIWPGIADLIGSKKPIFVVGNKVDLLPQDGKGFLERVTHVLEKSVRAYGFAMTNIKYISLISAKTGFGVEDLITKLHSFWEYKGDVYIVGCTNVGKSSLFNVLLQSDYCKVQAVDLIQRATTSLWPGTTLNLLKFPIMRPSGSKLYHRMKRLQTNNRLLSEENKLRRSRLQTTKNPKYASLIGHVDRTFSIKEPLDGTGDMFTVKGRANASGRKIIGIDEKDELYALSKWCYDTPGVVQPDQITHLLTTDELMLTLPKNLLRPLTFNIKPKMTIFIAGLGRLDFVDGTSFARFTVFCSSSLPITICTTDAADDIYKEFLGTDLFKVPTESPERLKLWPGLEHGRDFKVKGIDWEYSCADVVLSNAGWIAVTCGLDLEFTLKVWTPERRGVYIRESLLPKAVSLRGKKIRGIPAFRSDKFYIKN